MKRFLVRRPVLVLLTALVGLCGCRPDRADDSEQSHASESEQVAQQDNAATNGQGAQQPGGRTGTGRSQENTPVRSIELSALADELGFERTDDLPEDTLPPIPSEATLNSGLYRHGGRTIGLVYAKYPRSGYARPHIEDIAAKSRRGEPTAVVFNDAQVIEVRAGTPEQARQAARELADRLHWELAFTSEGEQKPDTDSAAEDVQGSDPAKGVAEE